MGASRYKLNNRIYRIHERALRIACKDNLSIFENLLLKDNSVTVLQRNLQLFMIEIYKVKHDLNLSFMKQIFDENALPYNLRCSDQLQLSKAKRTGLGIATDLWEENMGDTTTRTEKTRLP